MPQWVEVLVIDVLAIALLAWLTIAAAWFLFVALYHFIWRFIAAFRLQTLINLQRSIRLFVITLVSYLRFMYWRHITPR